MWLVFGISEDDSSFWLKVHQHSCLEVLFCVPVDVSMILALGLLAYRAY